eukprot:CAMPEP_0168467072 /NCGR_PEP_ID=MMETSP0228-20121227/56992_1 /TAXON_ID=133427 /ORGANISM="Protoceratium reticulatum, Strain CCCM 535 (=CCMP 1889)" /LENGTH=37 /DNA_ID= /DNA_START= /DNA_END= /DNA_ORIENTATION=
MTACTKAAFPDLPTRVLAEGGVVWERPLLTRMLTARA